MNESLKIAVAGLGTVGAETLRLIQEHGDLISARCGRPIAVSAVAARDRSKPVRSVKRCRNLRWSISTVSHFGWPICEVKG